MYDCLIVGAGPAGSSVAYALAKQGHSVLLVEKAVLPRYKPCSGALSPGIAQWFDFDFGPAIERQIRRVRYTWKLEDEITSELKTEVPIWLVNRNVFDHFLVKQAIAKGALLKDDTAATGIEFKGDSWAVETTKGSFQGRYLVAADGAEGPTSKWLGFKDPKLKKGAILEMAADAIIDDTCALSFEFGLVKNGCMWCFPKQQGYTIGAATFLGNRPQDYQKALAQYAPAFSSYFKDGQTYIHGLKLWEGNRPLHTQRAVVVGEAAAIVDPLTAEGIRHGMYSGIKAAEAIDNALRGNLQALVGYTEAMQAWGNNMQWAQRIAGVFYRVPGVGYRVGIKRPTATTRMGQLLAGDIQYSDIANRVIKRMSAGLIPGRK
ncbi:MAG: geranylgeranyl reductase family protein [Leptolyngbya sp. SIO1E4]|nr:geranylgeranyl reductase family protein [Leptolyngbya sp. SIO1E4]